jgi:uncharacterized protein with GYD domain
MIDLSSDVGSLGNVRAQTLRACRANEIKSVRVKVNWLGCSQCGGVDPFEI